jgi:hypothetical protein
VVGEDPGDGLGVRARLGPQQDREQPEHGPPVPDRLVDRAASPLATARPAG